MKKLLFIALLFSISFQLSSCKSEVEKKETVKKEFKAAAFSLKTAQNSIGWIAYKTTDKVGVKGEFKKVNITNNGEGDSAKEAIHNTEFSIPVSSLFTNLSDRDYKLKKFFFGVMDNTKLLSGKLTLTDDTTGIATITMNSITAELPFTYTILDKEFKLTATMNLDNWNGQKAIASINEVCNDLHKGADGISKTWSEVAINITTKFK